MPFLTGVLIGIIVDPEGSAAEREARVRETYRLMSLRDLRDVEFLRLLRLAHSEGLLAELLKVAEYGYRQDGRFHWESGPSSDHRSEWRNRSRLTLSLGRDRSRAAFEWLTRKLS